MSDDPEISAEMAWQFQADHINAGKLVIWTVYDHPRDFPSDFIARPFVTPATAAVVSHGHLKAITLWELRRLLPPGLTRMDRDINDDPVIVETWL